MTRWLVTGAAGQLGSDLQRLLAGADVTAIDLPELDLTDGAAVADFVRNWAAGGSAAGGSGPGHPLVVVNAAAWTNVDGAEEHEDTAHRVNAEVPGYLAAAGGTAGATMIHISTDYVFAGDATVPYEVDAPVAPRSAYGRTKAAGERAVLDPATGSGAPAYVVRTAWVYGETGTNFVKTMVRLERERETVSVVDDQQGSPTWSRHLAAGLIELAGSNAPAGIYHCTGGGHTTWYGFTQAIFEELGADPARVLPTTTAAFPRPAPRPAYSVLSDAAWRAAGLPPMPLWRDALREAFALPGDPWRSPA